MRKYYTDQEPADCLWCGRTLPAIRHWRTLFCDKKCGNAYFNSLTAEARAEERAKLTCHGCGKPIVGARRKDQRYCSERCRRAFRCVAAE